MWLSSSGGTDGIWGMLLPFVLMFAIFYFLLIRPQQKKAKELRAMLNALQRGDRITTVGGLHGTIDQITDDTVVLKVNDVTKLTFDRSAVKSVVSRAESGEQS